MANHSITFISNLIIQRAGTHRKVLLFISQDIQVAVFNFHLVFWYLP